MEFVILSDVTELGRALAVSRSFVEAAFAFSSLVGNVAYERTGDHTKYDALCAEPHVAAGLGVSFVSYFSSVILIVVFL